MANKQKKIHNRFDQWEILSVFVQSSEDYLSDKYSWRPKNFYIKFVLGILMAINAYLCHWGWPWPQSYNYIVFSIFFYYIASYIFQKLNTVTSTQGKMIGQFIVNGRKMTYHMKLTQSRQDYILQEVDGASNEILRKKSFDYLQYFRQNGQFLQKQFHEHLKGFLRHK